MLGVNKAVLTGISRDEGGGLVYATMDPAITNGNLQLSNGNLTIENITGNIFQKGYLTVQKTTGLWAYELTQSGAGTSSNGSSWSGMDDRVRDYDSSNYGLASGTGSTGESVKMRNGDGTSNGVSIGAGYWNSIQAYNTPYVTVFDLDNRLVYYNKSGVMKASPVATGALDMWIGVSIYSLVSGILNCGQTPFTAESQALCEALAISLGRTVNQGIWQT